MAPTGAVPWTSERPRRRRRSWRRAILKGGGRSDGRRPARHGLAPRRRSLPHRAGCTSRCARGGCGGGGHAQRERRFWKRLRLPGRQLWRRRSRQPFPHKAAVLAGSVTAGGGRRAGDFAAAVTPEGAALLVASAFRGWTMDIVNLARFVCSVVVGVGSDVKIVFNARLVLSRYSRSLQRLRNNL